VESHVSTSGLTPLRNQNPQFAHGLKLLKAMAYVPPDHINDAFITVMTYLASHKEV